MEEIHKTYVDYSNDTIGITKTICRYLINNNFYENDKIQNINLLERALVSYSIVKLFKWKIDITDIDIENLDNLETLCLILDLYIPKDKKRDFFIQYVYCIIYNLGNINRQEPIDFSFDKTGIDIKMLINDGIIEKILISESLAYYQVPARLLKEIKKMYVIEKNPVLKK